MATKLCTTCIMYVMQWAKSCKLEVTFNLRRHRSFLVVFKHENSVLPLSLF